MNPSLNHPDTDADLALLFVAGALSPADASAFETRARSGDRAAAHALADARGAEEALFASTAPVKPSALTRMRVLNQFAASQVAPSVVSIAAESGWMDVAPGVSMRLLHQHPDGRNSALFRLKPGARVDGHIHEFDEECLLLEGDFEYDDGRRFGSGDYMHNTKGSQHLGGFSPSGCLCLITSM